MFFGLKLDFKIPENQNQGWEKPDFEWGKRNRKKQRNREELMNVRQSEKQRGGWIWYR